MDGRTGLVVVCALAGSAWAVLVLSLVGRRLRAARPTAGAATHDVATEWAVPDDPLATIVRDPEAREEHTRVLLLQALRSDEPELRLAGITTLGRLGERHAWAIDALIGALADGVDEPVRVAGQLDRLAPRPGSRLPPLLEHPSGVVRFYGVKLLAKYPALSARHVPPLTDDPSPNVRAAALETLGAGGSGGALRRALRLLEDPHPIVRAQASRTAAALAPLASAPFVLPLLADRSWAVRAAAREALVAAGAGVAEVIAPALHGDEALRAQAALVLQDVGVVDALAADGEQLGRILDVGGERLRTAATQRRQSGVRLGTSTTTVAAEAAA
jgi:HEAT repeat protein